MVDGIRAFLAYPAAPHEIGAVLTAAVAHLASDLGLPGFVTWEESDVAGRFIRSEVLAQIDAGPLFIADITALNFNVSYEVGFAIGRGKPVILLRNSAIRRDEAAFLEIGLYDTLGYHSYANSRELAQYLVQVRPTPTLASAAVAGPPPSTPLFVASPKHKTDAEIRLFSRIKKARLDFQTYDPEEQGRLSAHTAINGVAQCIGTVVPLIAANRDEYQVHNIRAAFVAGLASGMNKPLLLLQAGRYPVPLDYRDLVSVFNSVDQIDGHLADFVPRITELMQKPQAGAPLLQRTGLATVSLGASAAENEGRDLQDYFVTTDEYHRVRRGEVQVVAGRKGSGKTALFLMVRNDLKRDARNVVLDLKPEGYQLLRFKEVVLDLMEEGTRDHTLTAFWEYLLLLETCHKLLMMDRGRAVNDHTLRDLYKSLDDAYSNDAYIGEGDFAERLARLTARIQDDFDTLKKKDGFVGRLRSGEITALLYKHDVGALRRSVAEYLKRKSGLWILVDNLDKGWPPHGLKSDDVRILRCLLDALRKMEQYAQNQEVLCKTCVFVRNDVYELLVDATSDRGKTSRLTIDWTDPALLRRLIKERIARGGRFPADADFDSMWRHIAVSHIAGEESSQYIIDRCLMRPRCLLDLAQACLSRAINVQHNRIEVDDLLRGEEAYSSELVNNICLEVRDVAPDTADLMYALLGQPPRLRHSQLAELLTSHGSLPDRVPGVVDLMLWFGLLGVVRDDGDVAYIYSVHSE